MLGVGRYSLGVVEIGVLAGFAWLGASAVRTRLLPAFSGAPAHLATAVLVCAILIWTAELLGSFGLFEPLPYLTVVILSSLVLWLRVGGGWGGPARAAAACFYPQRPPRIAASSSGEKPSKTEGRPHPPSTAAPITTLAALLIATIALVKFGLEAKPKLSSGMTGFDSTWYHGPFAAGFLQSGDTWSLHFIAPQFLAWFYPANSEVLHGVGMLAFDRDLLSPLLNLGWFVGCLAACWCIGRPYRVAPFSVALGAVALSLPALSDQAGEARNDIVGIFFLLAAVALLVNAEVMRGARDRSSPAGGEGERLSPEAPGDEVGRLPLEAPRDEGGRLPLGVVAVVGLAAGLAAGTKLNFLLPAAVIVAGLAVIGPKEARWRSLAVGGLAALAGGGYWYLRNLAHAGNPLPWLAEIGPISLPASEQALGGREGHSVLGYLTDGAVWSDWLAPGFRDGLTILWPLVLLAAAAGLLLALGRRSDPALRLAGAVGLAAALAWLIAPTSASGPEGIPRGFESGLRYLAPALVLGLAVLPATPLLRKSLARLSMRLSFAADSAAKLNRDRRIGPVAVGVAATLALLAVGLGYPIQRHYLEHRYESPAFTTPGLNAAFKWAQEIEDARIATTSTRQYPLFGRDLSNEVTFVGEEQPHGGFTAATTCRTWRAELNAGDYDYVVASRDRIEPGKPPYPPSASWTAGPGATVILRIPPTVIYELEGSLPMGACRRLQAPAAGDTAGPGSSGL
jgi:hypothetical protein